MESKEDPELELPFGTILGYFQGVEGYSNGPSDQPIIRGDNTYKGLYTGSAFQCVEFARRWLQASKGLNFHNLPFASHVWNLKYAERISDGKATSLTPIPNGSGTPPVPESFLIWKSTEKTWVGHIAVITEVSVENQYVRVAEQNIVNKMWPGNYARELKLDCENGNYFIRDENEIHGWVVIDFDVDNQPEGNEYLQRTFERIKQDPILDQSQYLDLSKNYAKTYAEINGESLEQNLQDGKAVYYLFEKHFYDKITHATMEMNFYATRIVDNVIKSDELLQKFGIPECVWGKLRANWKGFWKSGRNSILTQVKFASFKKNLKVIEYDSDPLKSIPDSTVILDSYAKAAGCDVGQSTAFDFESKLIKKIQDVFDSHVHVLIPENNKEVLYNALYLQDVITKANLTSTLVVGLNFTRDENQKFFDENGVEIKKIWKLWDWEIIIKDLETERNGNELKISDLLLNDDIIVYEPIWKIITRNKAIFALMSEAWQTHPYLLKTSFELNETIAANKYIKKPFFSYKGENIEIYEKNGEKIWEKPGKLENEGFIYQEFFEIQTVDGLTPIIMAWVVGGEHAGYFVREDKSIVTENEDCKVPSRVIF